MVSVTTQKHSLAAYVVATQSGKNAKGENSQKRRKYLSFQLKHGRKCAFVQSGVPQLNSLWLQSCRHHFLSKSEQQPRCEATGVASKFSAGTFCIACVILVSDNREKHTQHCSRSCTARRFTVLQAFVAAVDDLLGQQGTVLHLSCSHFVRVKLHAQLPACKQTPCVVSILYPCLGCLASLAQAHAVVALT